MYLRTEISLGVDLNGDGVQKDKAKGIELYWKAADKGNAYALGQLGYFYAQGDGVPKDSAKGIKLLQQAAEKGINLAALLGF